jgi:excinuclease ABC subunit C
MINQVLSRRVSHSEEDVLGDLLVIDGGKSQLNAAVAALKDLAPESRPPVISIAKGRAPGESDKIYVYNRKNPLSLPNGDVCLLAIMKIRDESHRYAHSFHTNRRVKSVIHSNLDDVPGIGQKKRSLLLNTFGSLKGVLQATDKQLKDVSGITSRDVVKIREYFNQVDKTKSLSH